MRQSYCPAVVRFFGAALLCALAWTFATPARADHVEDGLLDAVAVEGGPHAAEVRAALADMTPDALGDICDLLLPPNDDDDTPARLALHAAACYVCEPGHEALRRGYEQVLCEKLAEDLHWEVKDFLLRQLQFMGTERCTPAVAGLLTNDDELQQQVVATLTLIGGDAAKKALRDALPKVAQRGRIAVITALATLEDHASTATIRKLLDDDDRETRFAAAAAMGVLTTSPDEDARRAARLFDDVEPTRYSRAQQIAQDIRYYAKRTATGDADAVVAELEATFNAPATPSHIRCAMLHELLLARGADALPYITAGLAGDDFELRAAAREFALSLDAPDASQAIAGQLSHPDAPVRATVLEILQQRGDDSVLPAVLDALTDADADVRVAAITAVGALGGVRAVDPLLSHAASASRPELDAIRKTLAAQPGDAMTAALAARCANAPSAALIVALGALQDRRAADQLDVVLAATRHDDVAVRVSAFEAVGELAGPDAVPGLLTQLAEAEKKERRAIEDALIKTAGRAKTPDARSAPLLATLNPQDEETYCSLLRVLGTAGGDAAFDAITRAIGDERPDVGKAAYMALGSWPVAADAGRMLDVAEKAPDTKGHVLAMRAFARLLVLEPRKSQEMLELFERSMNVARRDDEKRLLLAKLGEARSLMALSLLIPYWSDAALCNEAAGAGLTIVRDLPGDQWPIALDALDQMLAAPLSDNLKENALRLREERSRLEGFITDWLVSEPQRIAGRSGPTLLDVAFPPERPDSKNVAWRRPTWLSDDPEQYWFIDLNQPTPQNDAAVYLFTRLHSPTTRTAMLELGSDDGVKAWLNGEVVHALNEPRGCDPSQDKVTVALREGFNDLLLKITNGGGGFGACARVCDTDGRVLHDVYADASVTPQGEPFGAPWTYLFDGDDLDAWRDVGDRWVIDNGLLSPRQKGDIWSKEQFGDFVLELDVRITPHANSGVFFRTGDVNDCVQTGIEMQVLDSYRSEDYGCHDFGAIYDCLKARVNACRPPWLWNHVRLVCVGPHINIWLNNEHVIEMNLDDWTEPRKNPDGSGNKFNTAYKDMPRRGCIGFQDHGALVWYRNVRVRPLEHEPAPAPR